MRLDRTACPDEEELRQFLLGRVGAAEAAGLEAHLESCPACCDRLAGQEADDALVATMRQRSTILETCQGPTVDRLIRGASRLPVEGGRYDFLDAPSGEELGRMGDYRVLREIGRGGMGVVFLAEDARLRRSVALKVILDARRVDAHCLTRFGREAGALARLAHPGIVRIFEVGRHRGRPYLALEYVAGGTLAAGLAGKPWPARDSAELVEQLAGAVRHAHEQGVFHRDLKPANVLLRGPSPEGGRDDAPGGKAVPRGGLALDRTPKITDFGLARQLDEATLTGSGDLLGTPGYMAPELTTGGPDRGPACDVYSLGAILYEMLTGRPPFRGENALDTLAQVRSLDPVPPRRLQPGVPRDLETVCLKCLEKDPARRYPSAAALADDLRRWLDGRPITARPAGVGERVLKWARRRPAAAALASVSALAAAALLGVGVSYEQRLRQELGNTERALALAEAEGGRAAAVSHDARATVRRMLLRTLDKGWNETPGLRRTRRGLAEEALGLYEKIARQEGDHANVRHDVAWAHLEAGKAQVQLGLVEEGRASLERALSMSESLAREGPADVGRRLLYADALAALGHLGRAKGSAVELLERAASELEDLFRSAPGAPGVRDQLARTQGTLGAAYLTAGRPADGLGRLERSLELNLDLARAAPGVDEHAHQVARTRLNIAQACYQLKQHRRGEREEELAEHDFERALANDRHNSAVIEALAALRVNRSYGLAGKRQLDEAVRYVSRNLPMLEGALRLEPDDPLLRDRAYRTYGVRATFEEQLSRFTDAAESWEKAVAFAPSGAAVSNRLSLVELWLQAGDYRKAVALADALRPELAKRPSAGQWRRLALLYERAGDLAGKDSKATPEERGRARSRCRAESDAALVRAVAAGAKDLLQKMPPARDKKR
jgi:eukaryotic-like serine/threonine-protein kinase